MSAIRTILNGKNSVQGATGLLVVTLLLSNVLGLIRDRLLAAKIPASELDVYYAAFRLPDLLTNLIVVGAIAVIFIPVFTELKTKDQQRAWAAANAILNAMILILATGSLLLWIFMPSLMPLVVPNFRPDELAETITLARWLSLTPVLFGFSYILSGILNSFHRFVVYSLAPLFYNGSIIAATALFADRYPIDTKVFVVVLGVVAGAFLHMAIQLPVAATLGWQWRPILSLRDPAVRKVGRLMGPRIIGLLGLQMVTVVATAISSGWAGAITYYNLANNIQTMPTAVFANSVATALFPTIAQAAADNKTEAFKAHVLQGIRWILFLLIPATVGLILLRIQVVRLILGAGFFGWEATQTTADVLGWFAISIVATGLVPLLARAFYARQNTTTPMVISLIASIVIIGLSFSLADILPETIQLASGYQLQLGGVAALAIAFSIGTIINATLLLISLQKSVKLPLGTILPSLLKIGVATLTMALGVQLTKTLLGRQLDLDFASGVLVQTAASLLVGVGLYLGVAAVLGSREWDEIKKIFPRRNRSTTTSITPA
jgi:putative peptidoglycan lipid II flippase